MSFEYGARRKLMFLTSYIGYKFLVPFEVKRPRMKMLTYEFTYSMRNALGILCQRSMGTSVWPFKESEIETRFGKFKIRPRTADAAVVSPAFERRDVVYLLRLISRLLGQHESVLFIDVGADIGTYSVTVLNAFPNAKVDVLAFEPVESSRGLLLENIRRNRIAANRIQLEPCAVGSGRGEMSIQIDGSQYGNSKLVFDRAGTIPVSSKDGATLRVDVKPIDDFLPKITQYDAVIIKMDIEGAESQALDGAKGILSSNRPIFMVVEDFVDPGVISWLERHGAEFLDKLTSYNSWWRVAGTSNH